MLHIGRSLLVSVVFLLTAQPCAKDFTVTKNYNSKISSKPISEILNIPHPDLVRLMAEAVAHGYISKSRLPANPAGDIMYNRATYLSLRDLGMLMVYAKPEPRTADAVFAAWVNNAKASSATTETEAREARVAGVISLLFKNNLPYISFIKMVRDGNLPPKAGLTKAFRIDGDHILIAPCVPYLSTLCDAMGVTTKMLTDALKKQPGAYRVPPKKWNGYIARSVGMPIDQFLFAAEND